MSSATSSSRTGPSARVRRRTDVPSFSRLAPDADERQRLAQPARRDARLVQRGRIARLGAPGSARRQSRQTAGG